MTDLTVTRPGPIDVSVDDARTTGVVDPLGRERYVGVGCALENLVLGCQARGLRPAVTLLPDGSRSDHVAHVGLTPAAPQPNARHDALYDAIGRRHTTAARTNLCRCRTLP